MTTQYALLATGLRKKRARTKSVPIRHALTMQIERLVRLDKYPETADRILPMMAETQKKLEALLAQN